MLKEGAGKDPEKIKADADEISTENEKIESNSDSSEQTKLS